MIEENLHLSPNIPVLEQLIRKHGITYKELAIRLGTTERTLQRIRKGDIGLKLSMQQIKVLVELLEPFEEKLEDLPNDWILEKKKS